MNTEKTYKIFKDDYGKYKVGLSRKNQNDEWERAYFPVKFKKDVELENETRIKIQEYWLDFYNWKHEDKKGTTFYLFINQFEIVETQPEAETEKASLEEYGDQVSIKDYEFTDAELPF